MQKLKLIIKSKSSFQFIFSFFTLLYLIFAFNVSAQTPTKQTITVSPQLVQLDLSRDPAEAEYTYTNNTNQTIELALSMQDVKELEDRGIPGIVDPNVTKDYQYGLSSWARFSNNNLVIGPGESKTVTVFIDKTRLTAGGHYGTVLAELQQVSATETVKLRAILSSLLFVRAGNEYEQESANIVGLETNSEFLSFPTTVTFRLQNAGNVDVTPYGLVIIKDIFGNAVARGKVNENSLITLPDSTRRYTVAVDQDSKFLLPGIYTANVDLHYGKRNFKTDSETGFFSLGSVNILGVVVFVIIAAVLIIILKRRKKRSSQ